MFGFSGTRHLQDIDKATACHLIEMYRENETVLRETLLAQSALEEHMRYEQEYADLAAKEDRKAQTKDNRFSPASYPSKLLAASKLFASFQASCEALFAATSDVETKLNGMVASSHEVDPLLIEQVTAIWLSLSAALKALQERLGNTGKEVCILFDQVVGGWKNLETLSK